MDASSDGSTDSNAPPACAPNNGSVVATYYLKILLIEETEHEFLNNGAAMYATQCKPGRYGTGTLTVFPGGGATLKSSISSISTWPNGTMSLLQIQDKNDHLAFLSTDSIELGMTSTTQNFVLNFDKKTGNITLSGNVEGYDTGVWWRPRLAAVGWLYCNGLDEPPGLPSPVPLVPACKAGSIYQTAEGALCGYEQVTGHDEQQRIATCTSALFASSVCAGFRTDSCTESSAGYSAVCCDK